MMLFGAGEFQTVGLYDLLTPEDGRAVLCWGDGLDRRCGRTLRSGGEVYTEQGDNLLGISGLDGFDRVASGRAPEKVRASDPQIGSRRPDTDFFDLQNCKPCRIFFTRLQV
jgi:hypothetical protein